MGVTLSIYGIRKPNQEELKSLSGNVTSLMAGYAVLEYDELEDSLPIAEMLVPVKDINGHIVYVCRMEELAYYYHKSPYGRDQIESFIDAIGDAEVDWDARWKVVPRWCAEPFFERRPTEDDEEKEIIVFLYG